MGTLPDLSPFRENKQRILIHSGSESKLEGARQRESEMQMRMPLLFPLAVPAAVCRGPAQSQAY